MGVNKGRELRQHHQEQERLLNEKRSTAIEKLQKYNCWSKPLKLVVLLLTATAQIYTIKLVVLLLTVKASIY